MPMIIRALICIAAKPDGRQRSPDGTKIEQARWLGSQVLEDEMITKYLAAALLSTALMTGVASAQTATTTTTDRATTAMMHKDGQWRSSKLIGVDVYNDANEKIGDIEELIVDKSGKIEHVVLGVGGFLGMGEHYVAVSFDKLKWVNEAVRSTSASSAPAQVAHRLRRLRKPQLARQLPPRQLTPSKYEPLTSSGILIMRCLTRPRIS